MIPSLYQSTPSISVLDNRSLLIRDIRYHRHPDTPEITDERLTLHTYNTAAFLEQSLSPRQQDLRHQDNSIPPNIKIILDLNGNTLCTDSTDQGLTYLLQDTEGRPTLRINAIGITTNWQYENASLPGRPLSVTETNIKGESRVAERFIWGSSSIAEKNLNLAGQCIRYYHTAGLDQTDSLAIAGNVLVEKRQLIINEQEADWQTINDNDLSEEIFFTHYVSDATGAILTQTDPLGNIQRQTYNIAGQLTSRQITPKGEAEQSVIHFRNYSAAGQIIMEVSGNGVITHYIYEPETQRLINMKIERPIGHPSGAAILQDLRYGFDPVGNILSVHNDAEETRFWRNQRIVPEKTYIYDSLYQLVKATGREMANLSQQTYRRFSSSLFDNTTYTLYTRIYTYDRDSNLTRIQHSAPATNNNHTTTLTVSSRSNRAVLDSFTNNPDAVEALFDAGGHQQQLILGQTLSWNQRGELQQVTPVNRETQSDKEWYHYDAGGQRSIKITEQQKGNIKQTSQTAYLPQLERRQVYQNASLTESYAVINIEKTQLLVWETGKPTGIENYLFRYNHSDQTSSYMLETDKNGLIISLEEFYPYGETAVWLARSQVEGNYKQYHYAGKERDATGLYYYGHRYYQSWLGRWLSADPAGVIDGLNQYRMVRNNPINYTDVDGLAPTKEEVASKLVDRIRSRRADQAFLRMQKNGVYLKTEVEKYKYVENNIKKAANDNASKYVLKKLNQQEQDFYDHFVNLDFYLVHSTNANLINSKGDLIIYSRETLKNKGIDFPENNSTSADVYGLGNDGYVFFSLEAGEEQSKKESRFGNTMHKIKFSHNAFKYASVSLLDQLTLELPTPKIDEFSHHLKEGLRHRRPTSLSIFFPDRKSSIHALAAGLISISRHFPQDKDLILNTRGAKDINRLIRSVYSPEVRIPKMVGIKSGDYQTYRSAA